MEDQRKSLRRRHMSDQQELWTAARRFKASLQEYRRWRVGTAGTDIESLIEAGQTREARRKIQQWYQ